MKNTITILICFLSVHLFGQEVPKPISPSPSAATLAKYGDVPVSMYTGIPQISIPLYQIKGKDISLPLSLSYYSGGIKTEENSSWVGLGWSLNAGGVITRVVRGLDDDAFDGYSTSTFPATLTQLNYFDEVRAKRSDSEPDLYFYNFNGYSGKFVLNPYDKPTSNTVRAFLIPQSDLEIIYDYNGGFFTVKTPQGVKYTFGETETTSQTTYSCDAKNNPGVKTDATSSAVSSWYMSSMEAPVGNEKITFSYNSENYQYEGTKTGTAGYRTTGVLHSLRYAYTVTKIYGKILSEINFPATGLKVSFKADKTREDLLSVSGGYNPKALEEIQIKNTQSNQLLKKYILNTDYFNTTSYRFDVNQVAADEKYLYKRLKLLSVQEVSGDGLKTHPPYLLEYSGINLPPKNSEFQDHWGFVNQTSDSLYNYYSDKYMIPGFTGEVDHSQESYTVQCLQNPSNINVTIPVTGISYINVIGVDREPNPVAMQAGILKKITYPTGGSSVFDFEANKYAYVNQDQYYEPKYQGYYYGAFTERPGGGNYTTAIQNVENTDTFTVEKEQLCEVVFDLENTIGPSGINFTNNEVSLTGTGPAGSGTLLRLYYDWNPNFDPYRMVFFDEVSQQTANLPLNISNTTYTITDETDIPASEGLKRTVIHGTRLVRLYPGITYTLHANRQYDSDQYCSSPGPSGCLVNNNFTNIALNTPVMHLIPIDENTTIETLTGGLRIKQITDKPESSSPEIVSQYSYWMHDQQGQPTKISSGTVLERPNHYWNELFQRQTTNPMCDGCSVFNINPGCMEDYIQVYSVFNISGSTPLPLQTTQGSNIGYREVQVSKPGKGFSIYKYTSPFDFPDLLPEMVNEQAAEYLQYTNPVFENFFQVGTNVLGYSKVFVPARTYDWKRGLLDSVAIFNEQGHKVSGERNLYTFHDSGSEIRGIYIFFDKVEIIDDIALPNKLEITDYVDYKETTGWAALTHKITSTDFNNNNVYKYTDYEYASANHIQPTLIKETNSDNKLTEQHFILSADKPTGTQTTTSVFNEMVNNRHILYNPIKTETKKNGVLIEGQINNFKFENNNILEASTEISKGGNYEARLTYDNYDTNGNLLSYKKDGAKTCFLWSYGGEYPVAQITNVDYSTVLSVLGGQTNIDNFRNTSNPTNAAIAAFLVPLRNNIALPNVQITSYTYDPLIGITSMTDARNNITTYEYDDFQRLMNIKDQNGNIKTHYCYNYAGQSTDCAVSAPPSNPIPGVYARIEVTRTGGYNDGTVDDMYYYQTGDVYLKFYSDASCTIPLTLTSEIILTLKQTEEYADDFDAEPYFLVYEDGYTARPGNSSFYLGNMTLSVDNEYDDENDLHHFLDTDFIYDLSPGDGYTRVAPTSY